MFDLLRRVYPPVSRLYHDFIQEMCGTFQEPPQTQSCVLGSEGFIQTHYTRSRMELIEEEYDLILRDIRLSFNDQCHVLQHGTSLKGLWS